MSASGVYEVWYRDDAACSEAIVSGAAVDVELSAYGANDLVLDFLVASGLWGVLTSMEPDLLRKNNGKPPRALVLRFLVAICVAL